MLSKEEIEKIKQGLKKELSNTIKANECGLSTNDFSESIKILEGALQYIEELEISNAELDNENNRLEKIEFERDKQNKMIDEMSCMIYDYANLGSLGICDCELEDGRIDLNLCNQTLTDRNCKQCIKQYFEKKVEEK